MTMNSRVNSNYSSLHTSKIQKNKNNALTSDNIHFFKTRIIFVVVNTFINNLITSTITSHDYRQLQRHFISFLLSLLHLKTLRWAWVPRDNQNDSCLLISNMRNTNNSRLFSESIISTINHCSNTFMIMQTWPLMITSHKS